MDSAKDFITEFASALNISFKSQEYAIRILSRRKSSAVSARRKNPRVAAAAALYLAILLHLEKRTQRQIAKVAGITQNTLYINYQILLENLI